MTPECLLSRLGGWGTTRRGGSLEEKLISFEYFESEVPLKHPNNIRCSEERPEPKMGFEVISIWIIEKAVDMDGKIRGEYGLREIKELRICRNTTIQEAAGKEEHRGGWTFHHRRRWEKLITWKLRVSRRAEWSETLDATEKLRKARKGTLGLIRRKPMAQNNFRARWRQQIRCSELRSQQEVSHHVIIPRWFLEFDCKWKETEDTRCKAG